MTDEQKQDGELDLTVIEMDKELGELATSWGLIIETAQHSFGLTRAIFQVRKAKHSSKSDVLRETLRYPSALLHTMEVFRPLSSVVNGACAVFVSTVVFVTTLMTTLLGLLLLPFGYRCISSEIAAGIHNAVQGKKDRNEQVTGDDIRAAAESVLRGE